MQLESSLKERHASGVAQQNDLPHTIPTSTLIMTGDTLIFISLGAFAFVIVATSLSIMDWYSALRVKPIICVLALTGVTLVGYSYTRKYLK
jgi:hypothetical protein